MSYTNKDGLRSWIYLLFVVFTTTSICGAFYSFGLFLDIFLNEYGGTNSEAGWVGSILLFSQGISSLGGIYLFRFFGLRRVMFTSAILAVFAFVSTPHVPNLEFIFLTFSVPFGIAVGFYECVSVVSLRDYFDKQLGFATGIRYVGSGAGPMIFSYIIPIIFDLAGWHTMMTCFSSLGLVFILYALIYKPLAILDDQLQDSFDSMLPTRQQDKVKTNLLKEVKLLLKDKKILMVLTGNALFSVVEYVPNMFMIQYARSLEYPISSSKWMLVIFSLLSMVSRSLSGYVSDYVMKFNKMTHLLSLVIVLFGVFSAFCSFTQSLILMTVYMGGIGILDGVYWVILSLVAMEISHQHSDITFALMLTATAFGYLLGPPAIGWLYDATDTFSQVLYAVSAGAVTGGIFILAGALSTPEQNLHKEMLPRSVVETSKQNKCSLIVFERETVI